MKLHVRVGEPAFQAWTFECPHAARLSTQGKARQQLELTATWGWRGNPMYIIVEYCAYIVLVTALSGLSFLALVVALITKEGLDAALRRRHT